MRPRSGPRPAHTDLAIAQLAGHQHGLVTRRQLLALGASSEAIKWRVKAGRLHPVHQGVYAVGHPALTERGRELAAVLACGAGAVLSHTWAAVRWAMPIPRRSASPEVLVPDGRILVRPGLRARCGSLLAREIRQLDRIPVTAPARTIRDLATILDQPRLERVVADALKRNLVRHGELVDQLERNRGGRGIAKLRRLVESGRELALTFSEAEVRLLGALRNDGVAEPEVNAWVGGYKVDLLWRDARLIVEVDGYEFHSDREAFEADRLRDAELGDLGYRVIRVTWRQLVDQMAHLVTRIVRALSSNLD